MADQIAVTGKQGIARLVLNKPEAYNAFDLEMVRLLADTLIELAADHEIAGVVITGSGKAFCAGGDLGWANDYGKSRSEAFHQLAARYHQAIVEIRRMPKPVVAAINGMAAGGGFSLALACDFRVMATSAVLKQAYTSNGLSIDGGGTFTLPRLVGMARALEIAAFDPVIDSRKALSWGLVTEVTDDGQAVERGEAMCLRITIGARSSFAASKKLITEAYATPFETHLENERRLLSWCADQLAGREGIAAFLEKRKPRFEGLT